MEYKIKIDDQLVEVTKEVYQAYYRMKNHEDYLERKDKEKGLVRYHALDCDGMLGVDVIPDKGKDILGDVIRKEERSALNEALKQLRQRDRQLIEELYFNGQTERELAKRLGVCQSVVHRKKARVLEKLKKLLKNFEF